MNSFKSTTKIVNATADDPTRPTLSSVLVTNNGSGESVYLIATDGHTLAVSKEDGRVDKPILVPREIFSKTKKADRIEVSDGKANNDTTGKFVMVDKDITPDQYPDISSVIPTGDMSEYRVVSINPKYLLQVAQAICDKGGETNINLLLPPETEYKGLIGTTDPIMVMPQVSMNGNQFGLIMPMHTQDPQPKIRSEYRDKALDVVKAIKEGKEE